MNYATLTFLLFLLASGCVYFLIPKKLQWYVLLTASLTFYVLACGAPIIFLCASAAVTYFAAIVLSKLDDNFVIQKKHLDKDRRKVLKNKTLRKKKLVVFIAVTTVLLMLLSTKYFNFVGSIINEVCSAAGLSAPIPVMEMLMPLGISYYTLMAVSYIADCYRGTAQPEKNPLMLLLYLCYFPHIVEGPFDRFDNLSKQFRKPHRFDYGRIKNGGIRFVWGLFKKIVIADRAALIVNTVFSDTAQYSGSLLFLSVMLYTLQIYAEFSGCMDMVCGASEIFGISIAENFRRPFFSTSINEFWRRWHITLGTWLKDYVFYPISLSGHFKKLNTFLRKHIKNRHLLTLLPNAYALFFVWFCNGLWHGASVKYIVYGLYYYALMMLGLFVRPVSAKVLNTLSISKDSGWYRIFEIIRTSTIVCFGMLIFRSATLNLAGSILVRIFTDFDISGIADEIHGISGVSSSDLVILAASAMILFTVSLMQECNIRLRTRLRQQPLFIRWSFYLILLFSVIIFGAYGGNFTNTTFIYGEF